MLIAVIIVSFVAAFAGIIMLIVSYLSKRLRGIRAVAGFMIGIGLFVGIFLSIMTGDKSANERSVREAVTAGLQLEMGTDKWPPKGMSVDQRTSFLTGALVRDLQSNNYPSLVNVQTIEEGPVTVVEGTLAVPGGRHRDKQCTFTALATMGKYNPPVHVTAHCPWWR